MRPLLLLLPLAFIACAKSPRATVTLDPVNVGFEPTEVGQTSSRELQITNSGDRAVTVTVHTDPPFSANFDQATIAPGEGVRVPFTFAPIAAGSFTAGVTVQLGSTQIIGALSGDGVAPPECGASAPPCYRLLKRDGGCEAVPLQDGTACQTECAVSGVCHAGSCEGVNPACDDEDRCTADGCGPQGCTHAVIHCPQPTSTCQSAFCDPAKGCGISTLTDGTLCGNNLCGATDVCNAGACIRLQQTAPNCSLHICPPSWLAACDGGICTENPLPAEGDITDGVSLSSSDVLFVSNQGSVLRWDGASLHEWARLPSPNSIWASADDDVWVGSFVGNLQHFDGQKWTEIAGTSGCGNVVGLARANVVCGGSGRLIQVQNGVKSAELATSDNAYKLAVDGNAVWAASSGGAIRRFENGVLVTLGSAYPLNDVIAAPDGGALIAGSGTMFHIDSAGRSQTIPVPSAPYALGAAGRSLFAFTANSAFARYDGNTWRNEPTVAGFKYLTDDVFTASNESDVWAAVRGLGLSHYDGLGWVRPTCGVSDAATLYIVAASPDGGALA
ncbi:MAG: hypothetical protein ACJ790_19020, partial [Myxococcaceae bacterium]